MKTSERGTGHPGGVAAGQLRAFIERIERLEEEKKSLSDDIRDVYAEAKGNGFDTKVMREVVKLRKMDPGERAEREAVLDLYLHALGMLADTPLGEAAIERDLGEGAAEKALGRRGRAASSALRKAVEWLGEPTDLTDEEKADGGIVAFERGDGRGGKTRMTLKSGAPAEVPFR